MSTNSYAYHYDGVDSLMVSTWKISKPNFPISQTAFVAFTYRLASNPYGPELKYKIEQAGIIVKESCKQANDIIVTGDVLFFYEQCSHDTLMKDLCAVCGVNIEQFDADVQKRITANTSVSMVHSIPELRVSRKVAENLGRADETRLLSSRKLVLLVDLDQTIIHSTNQNVSTDIADIFHYQLYGPNSPWYHTKFRPFMLDFLEEISKYYELHICTFGARRYAHQIAHLIDPKGLYFPKDRILSRDEFFDPCSKTGNMKSLFPCGDSMVCIIDDRVDVWKHAANVVHVKPYICFKTDDINAPEKLNIGFKGSEDMDEEHKDGAETNDQQDKQTKDEQDDQSKQSNEDKDDKEGDENKKQSKETASNVLEDHDDYLLHLQHILVRVHREYFKEYDEKRKYRTEGEEIVIPDLKQIIPRVRRRALQGVNLVFSGVIATNVALRSNRFYRLAESLGAIVTEDVIVHGSPKTTHLVAAKWGTTKVNRCMKHENIKLVTPEWLLSCAERWERVAEEVFALTKDYVYDMNSRDDHKKVFIPYHSPEDEEESMSLPSTSSANSSPKTILELSPLANFSTNEIDEMEKEVEDEISGDDGNPDEDKEDDEDFEDSQHSTAPVVKDDDEEDEDDESYAEEGEYPRGWRPSNAGKKWPLKRSRQEFDEAEESDNNNNEDLSSQSSSSNDGSIGSIDDEMVAAFERELNS